MKIINVNQKFYSQSYNLSVLSIDDINAGFTSNTIFLEISTPLKNWALKFWLIPIYKENWPIGSLPKSIYIEKINDVVGIYLAVIVWAPWNPFIIEAVITLLQ